MNRRGFYLLLQRYLSGDCTKEERELVEQWYELLDDDHNPQLPETSVQDTVDRLWLIVQEKALFLQEKEPPSSSIPAIPVYMRWLAAAAVTGVIGWAIYVLTINRQPNEPIAAQAYLPGKLHEVVNDGLNSDTVVLWDNSRVILEPRSKLYYAYQHDNEKREVYLEGNAFFRITKNKQRPFYVYSRNIVAQVLGTSFYIKTNKITHDTEVSVCTGKVAVYENHRMTVHTDSALQKRVVLQPNQKTVYTSTGRTFITSLADAPLPLAAADREEESITALNFEFDETPVSIVMAQLEAAYRIRISVESKSLAACLFSGDIKGQNLYDQLDIVCAAVQASYEVRGTSILVKAAAAD